MNEPEHPAAWCLRIEVLDSEPAIWRRFCVDSQISLAQLHEVLAAVMGWSGEEDYRFKVPHQSEADSDIISSADATIHSLNLSTLITQPGDSFLYTYSLAKGWIHKVSLESWQHSEPNREPPYVLAGEQACPPEFCIGIWDYEGLIDRLSDSDAPDYDCLWENVGYDFDPARFDLQAANQRLTDRRQSA